MSEEQPPVAASSHSDEFLQQVREFLEWKHGPKKEPQIPDSALGLLKRARDKLGPKTGNGQFFQAWKKTVEAIMWLEQKPKPNPK